MYTFIIVVAKCNNCNVDVTCHVTSTLQLLHLATMIIKVHVHGLCLLLHV